MLLINNLNVLARPLRMVVGLTVLALGAWNHAWWGALGLIPIAAASFNWCPINLALRLPRLGRKTA
jgi:hypothetical protein